MREICKMPDNDTESIREIPGFAVLKGPLLDNDIELLEYEGSKMANFDLNLDIPGWPPRNKEDERQLAGFLGLNGAQDIIIPPAWNRGGIIQTDKGDIVIKGFCISPDFKRKQLKGKYDEFIEENFKRYDEQHFGKLKMASALTEVRRALNAIKLGYKQPEPISIFKVIDDRSNAENPNVVYARLMQNGIRVADLMMLKEIGGSEATEKLLDFSIKKLPQEFKVANKDEYINHIIDELTGELTKRNENKFISLEIGVLQDNSCLNLDPHNISLAGEITDIDHQETINEENEHNPYSRKKQAAQYASFLGNLIFLADGFNLDKTKVQETFNIKLLSQSKSYEFFDLKRTNEIIDLLEKSKVVVGLKSSKGYDIEENGSEIFSESIKQWQDYKDKLLILEETKKEIELLVDKFQNEIELTSEEKAEETLRGLTKTELINLSKYFPEFINEIVELIKNNSQIERRKMIDLLRKNYEKRIYQKIILLDL